MMPEGSAFQRKVRFARMLMFLGLMTLAINSQAQKLPPILGTDSNDPSGFNKHSLETLKANYETKVMGDEAAKAEAQQIRNRLIGIAVDQTDAMFSSYVKNERKHRQLFQFVLDFLEIGTATAISLTNGERAKTVISEGLGALQTTRTALNKNFQLLERQILINKMEANRATRLTAILGKRNMTVTEYSWEEAAADLRGYWRAGTLDNALSSLSSDVGAEKSAAEDKLREVQDMPVTGPATVDDLAAAQGAFDVEDKLETALADDAKKGAALITLQKIVTKLAEDKEIFGLLDAKGISATTDEGIDIITALDQTKQELTVLNRRGLVRKINLIIIEVGTAK